MLKPIAPRRNLNSVLLSRRSLLLGAASLTLASNRFAFATAEPLNVVATTGMVADCVRVIGGDAVAVTQLMGEGVDPHLYRITQSDTRSLASADAVFWNGLYLEAQMDDFLARLGERKPVFALGESVPLDALSNGVHNARDPHIWMDPGLWRYVVSAAAKALISLRPEAEAQFNANAEAYLIELDHLSAYGKAIIATVPEQRRLLITAHDAFGYFGKAFGVEVAAVQGISTESEAGLQAIENLVDLIVTRQVAAVFAETSVSDRSVRALIEGATARGWQVTLGKNLYSDAMGRDGTPAATYLGMIEHNINAIAQGLGGTVPQGGFAAWKKEML